MSDEKSRFLTFMVIPDTAGAEVRRLRIPRRWVKLAAIGLGAAVLLFVGSIGHEIYLLTKVRQLHNLRSENVELKARIADVDDRVQSMGRVVDRVNQFDTRIRKITSFSDPDRNLAIGGPAGMDAETVRQGALETEGAQRLKQDLLGPDGASRELDLLEQRVNYFSDRAKVTEDSVRRLHLFLEDQHAILSATPSLSPARGWQTSRFGFRTDPYTGTRQMHAGLDISANIGTTVIATGDGVVTWAGSKGAYGNLVTIDHGRGLTTRYAHLSALAVSVGQKIERGTKIGESGNTGRSTGPHLHYEVRLNGIPQDPERFVLE